MVAKGKRRKDDDLVRRTVLGMMALSRDHNLLNDVMELFLIWL